MNNFINKIADIGLGSEFDIIERRRIRLLNVFSFVVTLIILTYVIVNLVVGSYVHAALLASCFFILVLPVFFFTYRQNHKFSRIYFVGSTLIMLCLVGYNSIINFDNRHNEVLFIGVSAVIVILYENPLRIFFFVITMLSCITMYLFRWNYLGSNYNVDTVLSLTNVAMSFLCIYLFTSIFETDLLRSLDKIQQYSSKLELQQKEISATNNELLNNKKLLRSLIDNIPIFLAMIDLDGNYIIANKKYQDAFTKNIDEIEGKNGSEFLSKGMNEIQNSHLEMCLRGEEPEFDQSVLLSSGEKMHVYGKIIPTYDENNKVKGFIQYGSDVTKLKLVESELLKVNATKNKLLSIVSHDMKGPINSLKGILYLSDSLSAAELSVLMKEINSQVDSVSFTMDNLLTWVRTQFEGFRIEPEEFDISEVVQQSIDLYKDPISNKKIKISIKKDEQTTIYADKNSMLLVCRNLISNAIKFTHNDGMITISSFREKDQTIMTVADNGMGISQKDIATIMNDSKQNNTRKGTQGELGTGLGLAFCRDVLDMNGARMEIQSEKDQGTEVRIIFPDT